MRLPADPPAEVEALREGTHIEPVTYAVLMIDNREGTESFSANSVTVYDEAGKAYEFSEGSDVIAEWGPTYTEDYEWLLNDGTVLSEDAGDKLNNKGIDLHNKYLYPIDALERGEQLMIGEFPGLPEEFTGVSVMFDMMLPDIYAEPVK